MKKFILLIVSMITAILCASCSAVFEVIDKLGTGLIGPQESSSISEEEQEESYTVTFKQDGYDDIVREVKAGESLTDIPTPQPKTGYTVVWDTEDFDDVHENIVVNAVVTANTYTITYDAGEGTVAPASQEVTYDSEVTLATPTRDGYDFTGWTCNGSIVFNGTWTIAENVTLVAQWVKESVHTYSVTFVQAGQTAQVFEGIEENTAFTNIPETQDKTGYTVVWNPTHLASLTNITANVVVEAIATPNTYTLTYAPNGGTVSAASKTVTYDSAIGEMAIPERPGYIFDGWEYSGTIYTATSIWNIASNATFTAQWTDNRENVSVTFINTDGSSTVKTVKYGDPLTDIPTVKEKTGYTVDTKWYSDQACTLEASFASVTDAMTVYAKATANTYTITYDAGEGAVAPAPQDVTYDSEVTLATPTRDGYDFTGWTYNGNIVLNGTWTIAQSVTLVAQWVEVQVNTYSVTFMQAGQMVQVFEDIEENTAFTNIPETQAKKGYTVVWNPEHLASLANITANVVVEAIATPNTYTLKYYASGGTVSTASKTVTYDSAIGEMAIPERPGYIFDGWGYSGTIYTATSIWNIASNATFTAQWTDNRENVSVTFINTDGNASVTTLKSGDPLMDIPTVKEKTGYTVDTKWYSDQACTVEASFESITEIMTVYAKATANVYTITYDAGEGTVAPASQDVTYDSEVTLATPTRDGYNFSGWVLEGTTTAVLGGKWTIAQNVTLVAQWVEVSVEKITVTFNQAGCDPVYVQVVKGESLTAEQYPAPQAKTGYTVAWDKLLTELTDLTENVTVTAVETAKTYTITLNANGGTVSTTTVTLTYGEKYTLPTPTREREQNLVYTFTQWTYNGARVALNGTWNIDAENVELVAQWEVDGWTGYY